MMNRKSFLQNTFSTLTGMAVLPFSKLMQDEPQLDAKLVKEFVRVGHGKMDQVKTMLAEHPTLLNAAWDWGNGDFETALGAASHVGNLDLARFLVDQGAQANIFTACLFGKMEIVRPMLTAFPQTLHAKGPHGYTLLHHAEKGGEAAKEVLNYLKELGASETRIKLG